MVTRGTCGLPTDDTWCDFHSGGLDADEFLARFERYLRTLREDGDEFDFSGFKFPSVRLDSLTFEQDVHFTGAEFRGDADFTELHFLGEADFDQVTFLGDASFWGCEFDSEAGFYETRFLKEARFSSEFKGRADFGAAEFAGTADFEGTRFRAAAVFGDTADANQGTVFRKTVSFTQCPFEGPSSFYKTHFLASVSFFGARFSALADLSFVRFDAPDGFAEFSKVHFSDAAIFHQSVFNTNAAFVAVFIGPRGLRIVDAEIRGTLLLQDLRSPEPAPRMSIRGTRIRTRGAVRFVGAARSREGARPLRLEATEFAFSDADQIDFVDCAWRSDAGGSRIRARLAQLALGVPARGNVVFDENSLSDSAADVPAPIDRRFTDDGADWDGGRAQFSLALTEPVALTHTQVADIYKALRRALETRSKYAEASLFHVREMEMRRFAQAERSTNKGRFSRWARRSFSVLAFYRALGWYGESYRLSLAWSAIVVLLFTAAWSTQGLSPTEALLRSTRAFLQIESSTLADIVERILGLTLIGLTALAVRRQFSR